MRSGIDRKYFEKRLSYRQPIPGVLVELRRDVDSETPDWVGSAVDISRRGMLLRLPSEVGRRELLYVTFTLGDSDTFTRLGAVVLRRDLGDLGALGFSGWPLEKEFELAAWLRRSEAEAESRPRPSNYKGPVVPEAVLTVDRRNGHSFGVSADLDMTAASRNEPQENLLLHKLP